MTDGFSATVDQLIQLQGANEISAKETVQIYLDRIQQVDPEIGAYITITEETALQQAEAVDALRAQGETLPLLAGIPAAIKDNICTKGVKTTCASKMLASFVPPYDAFVMEQLTDQRVVMLGKANMDEFAMGSTTENSYFHPTKNPRNPQRVPGGSSGGSAAAVAAGEAAFALGSDTGGSIRQPAAFCGIVGMKPTYGLVSRYGLVAFASSLDQIGPLTRTVRDSALILNAIAGHDCRDATSLAHPAEDYTRDLEKGVQGMRIAIPREYFGEGLSAAVKDRILKTAALYEKLGAELVDVSMESMKSALAAYYVISSAEASSNLARFDGIRYGYRAAEYADIDELYKKTRSEGFGREVKRRIMLGSFALSSGYYDAYYKKALQVRTLIMNDFKRVFDRCDVILSPVAPTTAYGLGEKCSDPLEMYMGDIYTVPVNIAGRPAISMPCGVDADGMPIGVQLMGPTLSEAALYRAAYALEQEMNGTESGGVKNAARL